MLRSLLSLALITIAISAVGQPIFTDHPDSRTVCPGECAPLAVEAVGGGLVFDWYTIVGVDTSEISGAAGTFYEHCDVDSAGLVHKIICKATDTAGLMTWSNVAEVTVDSCLPPVADFTWEWNHLELCFTNTSQRANTVFWFFGDGATDASNVDSVCHTYATKEIYYVTLQAFNDYDVDVIEKGINLLSVEDAIENATMNLYPNPIKNTLHIESDQRISSVSIHDGLGRTVLNEAVNSKRFDRNVDHLDPGVYLVRLTTESAQLTRRVVVE